MVETEYSEVSRVEREVTDKGKLRLSVNTVTAGIADLLKVTQLCCFSGKCLTCKNG